MMSKQPSALFSKNLIGVFPRSQLYTIANLMTTCVMYYKRYEIVS
jgi:hypothetical protein